MNQRPKDTQRRLKPTTWFFLLTTLAMVVMVAFGWQRGAWNTGDHSETISFVSGRVLRITEDQTNVNPSGARVGFQEMYVEIVQGPHRGRVVHARNTLFPVEQGFFASEGSRVLLFLNTDSEPFFAHVQSADRGWGVYGGIGLFFVLLVAVFGKSGLRSAYSLVFTFVVLAFVLLPLIVQGGSPALLTLLASAVIMVVSIMAIMGFSIKTTVSIIGSLVGIGAYVVFYGVLGWMLNLNGFNVQQADALMILGFYVGVRELLFCGILIASLGGIMDVSVSLASVLDELKRTDRTRTQTQLFQSAMVVSRDIIGSSANTLILAFTGTFFVSLLLFNVNQVPYQALINRVDMGIEVLRALAASSAMVLTAPATAWVGARLFAHRDRSSS